MTQHTNMSEKSLEDIIVNHLIEVNGYEKGDGRSTSNDYNCTYALDDKRLEAFLRATQPDLVRTSRIFDNAVNRSKFLGRVRDEITKRGVVDVLRKGVKHLSNPTFVLYEPYPSELSEVGKKLYKLNKFSVIRQLHYSKDNTLLSIDVVLFVNGLPVVTMELKNQITVQNTADALRQYRTDRDPKDLLFMHKRCAVHFAVDDVDIQMCTKLCGAESWFLPFNKGVNDGAGNPVNPNGLRTSYLWEDILTKARFSDILEHYAQVAIEEDPETKKKTEKTIWPRYHQLECVRTLLSHTEAHQVGEKYLIQHSAGSGKSNSITWLAYQLVEMKESGLDKFDSVILVTDRVNLDKQLRNNVRSFTRNENIVDWANTSGALKKMLEDGKKIILTTVQKFSFIMDEVGDLSGKHFAVVIDEAHSSQSGRMASNTNQVLSGEDYDEYEEQGINKVVRQFSEKRKMAPNANFYAFTATPKNKTLEAFGIPYPKPDGKIGHRPFHVYTMKQAIEEGFILDVLKGYTTYQSYYRIRKTITEDPLFERTQAMKKLRAFVESQPQTVAEKAKVIVEHFHNVTAHKIGGEARAMVVAAGIERAIDYYHAINKLLKERNSPYQTIVAFTGDFNYHGTTVSESSLNQFPSSQIEKKIKSGNYRILIVADKFQTGYDEPLLHTMYVDKSLSGVRSVQTLSRLNRTAPKKNDTCVIDFVNKHEEIERDFQDFYKTTLLSEETDPNKLNDLLATIEGYEIYTEAEVELLNEKFWSKAPRQEIDPILDTCVERFRDLDEDGQVACKSAIKSYIRTYEFLSTIMPESSIEWEKKQTFLTLLIHKLPRLTMEDLTKGLLEAVDFDRYRLQKQAERDIILQDEDTEIPPVPTSSVTGVAEPDMQTLQSITDEFNELFGNINWSDRDVVKQQIQMLLKNVERSETVRNSVINNDEETSSQDTSEEVQRNVNVASTSSIELLAAYHSNPEFREKLDRMAYDHVRRLFNPEYDEGELRFKMADAYKTDFQDFCDGEHYVTYDKLFDCFFKIVNAETIEDYQGLRQILRRTLNCLFRTEQREDDYRSWYADLVSRFEAYLKKIYWMKEGVKMPTNADGREPALRETVSYFPKVEALYNTRNEKFAMFRQAYREVYNWRNRENHYAYEIESERLPDALHGAVALYLFAAMVNAEKLLS